MSDWKQDVEEAAERIPSSREAKEKVSQLEDQAARASAKVAQSLREAEGRVREMGRSASATLSRTCDEVATLARQNPGTMTLVAFGAGVGTGLLFASRRSTPRWRSAVPAVAAVADAVVEILDRRRG